LSDSNQRLDKHLSMKKINFKLISTLVGVVIVAALAGYAAREQPTTTRAFGNLVVTFESDPLFDFDDFKPGDCTQKSITVTNNRDEEVRVATKSANEASVGDFDLATQLDFVISENGVALYGDASSTGPKTLEDFYTDSDIIDGIMLTDVAGGGAQTVYKIRICFDINSGNDYQETKTVFDLVFGEILVPVKLPPECRHLEGIVTEKIEGTEGNDNIHGTIASELITGLGGNDRIDPSSGHDCIVAGEGNDHVDSSTGNEVILGGAGNDKLQGGTGNDIIYGGEGNDNIDLGSGSDTAYGEAGNDHITGGSGDDYLDGGSDTDSLFGGSGTDTCVSGENLNSCEI